MLRSEYCLAAYQILSKSTRSLGCKEFHRYLTTTVATLTLVSRQKTGGAFSSQRRGCCGTFLLHCSCITAGRGQGSGTTAPGAPPIWASCWERNNFTRPKCLGDHVPLVVVGPGWGAASHKAVSSSQQHEYFTVTTGEWAAAGTRVHY